METQYKATKRDIVLFTIVMVVALLGEGVWELIFGK